MVVEVGEILRMYVLYLGCDRNYSSGQNDKISTYTRICVEASATIQTEHANLSWNPCNESKTTPVRVYYTITASQVLYWYSRHYCMVHTAMNKIREKRVQYTRIVS